MKRLLASLLTVGFGLGLAACFQHLPDSSVNRGCGPVDDDGNGCPSKGFVECALGADVETSGSNRACYPDPPGLFLSGGTAPQVTFLAAAGTCPGDCVVPEIIDALLACSGPKMVIARSLHPPSTTTDAVPTQSRLMLLTNVSPPGSLSKRVRLRARGAGHLNLVVITPTTVKKAGVDECTGRQSLGGAVTGSIQLTDTLTNYEVQSGFGIDSVLVSTDTGVAMELDCLEVYADCVQ